MANLVPFEHVARLPASSDNVAIAVRRIQPGEQIVLTDGVYPVPHGILEGHRFAVRRIGQGEPLLSWGLPFGHALRSIEPAEYVCNHSMLEALAVREHDVRLPERPNFVDHHVPFGLEDERFRSAPPVRLAAANERRFFEGYRRPGSRGVGTRNTVVIVGTTSRTASLARQLAERLRPLARLYPGVDDIVAVAHTEGGGRSEPNNATEILRALAGFLVHPNVGAVLAIDQGDEAVNNERLQRFMRSHGYPLDHVTHAFLSARAGLAPTLAEGERLVRAWLPGVNQARRQPEPLSELRVALQCGGSDAFSGVSGNPLAGRLVHEVVRQGGIGVLCETDELGGAEAYLFQNLRDLATGRALLDRIERTRERLGWHGVTFESNPSAGNKLRGLYNITLKSLGAVHKKDPRTRIDHVIDYAMPLTEPGFYFMDSPGNDLEAIAGEVAAGCNLILFITGNGSITNFPFVPTLKITTTTRRHELLAREMDLNAGRYLDGEPLEQVAADGMDLLIAAASGQRTRGEMAGHAQTSIWREWKQTDGAKLAALRARTEPDGRPLVASSAPNERIRNAATLELHPAHGDRFATERVGLVLPTSLCSSQIARLAAERMNSTDLPSKLGLARFVALPHSEGCGFGGEALYRRLHRTYRGYATHPNVALALLLEHGCEKIPNDVMRRQLKAAGAIPETFGWASVQLDGGIDATLAKIEAWFSARAAGRPRVARVPASEANLCVGFLSEGEGDGVGAEVLAGVAARLLAAGATVLVPETDALLSAPAFRRRVLLEQPVRPTLAYGEPWRQPGLHVVATESSDWSENLAGLGGCGAHVLVGLVAQAAQQGHPLLPVLHLAEATSSGAGDLTECDGVLSAASDEPTVWALLMATAEGRYVPKMQRAGLVNFQLGRGLLGVST